MGEPAQWTADERETVIHLSDADDLVVIWTAQLHVIRRLSKDTRFTLTEGSEDEHWATFSIPAKAWNPVTGAKRKGTPQTPEQRERAIRNLAKGRASQAHEPAERPESLYDYVSRTAP